MTFKATTSRLKDKVLYFSKKKNATDFVNNYKEISKFIAVNYKHGRPKMAMVINNTKKPTITVQENQ